MTGPTRAGQHDDHDHDDADADDYLDLDGLARYSKLSVRTLQRHLKAHEHPLPHWSVCAPGKAKGRVLVSRRAFDRWLDRFRVGAPAAANDPEDVSWIRRGFGK